MIGLADTSMFIAWESASALENEPPDEIAVSVITVGELRLGVLLAADVGSRERRLAAFQWQPPLIRSPSTRRWPMRGQAWWRLSGTGDSGCPSTTHGLRPLLLLTIWRSSRATTTSMSSTGFRSSGSDPHAAPFSAGGHRLRIHESRTHVTNREGHMSIFEGCSPMIQSDRFDRNFRCGS